MRPEKSKFLLSHLPEDEDEAEAEAEDGGEGMRHFRTILSLSLLVIIIGGFFDCGGGGGGGDNPTLPAPTATVTPASPALINGSTSIVIVFDTSMNSSTLSLGGSLAAESDGGIWSDTFSTNDTLTISPAPTWNDGAKVLTVDVNSAAGTPLATLSLSYTVDANLSVASISPPDGSLIANTVNIVVTYSETMDTSSLIPSGTMWNGSEVITWSTTSLSDDTLTISPVVTGWPIGSSKTIELSANNQAGNNLTVTLNYTVELDNDHDGSPVSLDCNDEDPTVYPDAPELCDGKDNDCDGQTDEDFPGLGSACGTGACAGGVVVCDLSGTGTTCSTAGNASAEVCDGVDNNCDGTTDEGFDQDHDGVTTCGGDCNDTVASIHPGASELCDGVDNDCDGQTDEGYNVGLPCTAGIGICQASGSYVCSADGTTTVCNAIPGAPETEICNGLDDDCDGQTDESLGPPFPLCEKQLGVCAGSVKTASLCQGGAWLPCDTADYMANNSSYESPEVTCDGLDNNCDGTTDEGCP